MECSKHILCRSCNLKLGKEQDVLMCGGCKLWHHRKCVPGVQRSFYAQFYVAMLQEETLKHWVCDDCCRQRYTVGVFPEPDFEKENPYSSLVPCANTPNSMDISDSESDSGGESDSELHILFEMSRVEREKLKLAKASLIQLEEHLGIFYELAYADKFIPPRPILFDTSPEPIFYTLLNVSIDTYDYENIAVRDNLGNEYRSSTAIEWNKEEYMFQCVRKRCGFQLRARLDLGVFLPEINSKRHNHEMPRPRTKTITARTYARCSYSVTTEEKVISARPILYDLSPQPVTYILLNAPSQGERSFVRDSHGNENRCNSMFHIHMIYWCVHEGCRFAVQVKEDLCVFLPGAGYSEKKHNHDTASSLSSPVDQAISDDNIVIPPRPVLFDPSPLPVTYTQLDIRVNDKWEKVARDCLGNEYRCSKIRKNEEHKFKCVHQGCGFRLRSRLDLGVFLPGRNSKRHNHEMPVSSLLSNYDREQMEDNDISVTLSLPTPRTTPYTNLNNYRRSTEQTRRHRSDYYTDSSMDDVDCCPCPDLDCGKSRFKSRKEEIVISARPILYDPSPQPVTYTLLYTGPCGTRFIRDSLGNKFKSVWMFFHNKKTTRYTCVHDGCHFDVQAREDLGVFLHGEGHSKNFHYHKTSPDNSSDDMDSFINHGRPASVYTSSTDSSSDNSSDDMDSIINHGRPASVDTSSTDSCDSSDEESESTQLIPDRPVSRNQARKGDREPESTKSIPDRPVSRNQARKGNREPDNVSITYTLTDGLANGNQARLTDSKGFCYQIKYKLGARVYWTCTEKVGRCSATVIQQRQDKFIRGVATHNHKPGQSQNTLTSTSANELHVKSAIQPDDMSAATVKTTHQNVKSAATVKPGQYMYSKSVTTPVSEETATCSTSTRLVTTDVLYQEITTCTEYYNQPKSVLTGSDGYVYKTKKVEKGKDVTVWKCTHKGPRGKCKGQVQYNYTTSTFADYTDPFIWTEDHKNVTVTVPHNHQPDMEVAVIIKMKAMIHRQVYGYDYPRGSAKQLIGLAKDSMYDWEKHVPTGQLVKRLKKWLWEKQRQYRNYPRANAQRYIIHSDW